MMFAFDIANLFCSELSGKACLFVELFETDFLFCGLPETFPAEEKHDKQFIINSMC